MPSLSNQNLVPCNKHSVALHDGDISAHLNELTHWLINTENNIKQLGRHYTFNNFISAMSFANTISELAEAENHHPCICIEWGKVNIHWWTHTLSGLHLNDFIMAARCDSAYEQNQQHAT